MVSTCHGNPDNPVNIAHLDLTCHLQSWLEEYAKAVVMKETIHCLSNCYSGCSIWYFDDLDSHPQQAWQREPSQLGLACLAWYEPS